VTHVGSADAAFVAGHLRVPANVYNAANFAGILDHHRRVVFDRVVMHHIRELCGDSPGLAEKKIQDVNAMGRDVKQRSASGLGGIDQPSAAALSVEPVVAGEFGHDRSADGAACE
jgi:hypothetical protein